MSMMDEASWAAEKGSKLVAMTQTGIQSYNVCQCYKVIMTRAIRG